MKELKITHESINVSFNKTLKLEGLTINYDLMCFISKNKNGKIFLEVQDADNYKTTFLGQTIRGYKEFNQLNDFCLNAFGIDLQKLVESDYELYEEADLLEYFLKNKLIKF